MPKRPASLRSALLALVVAAAALAFGAAPTSAAQSTRPVVVVGVTGVTWQDVNPDTTPALWQTGVSSAVGNLVVRSVRTATCPADGWLALSAGARAADQVREDRTDDLSGLSCRPLTDPADDGAVPGWSDYLAAAQGTSYGAQLGLLGAELAAAGTSAVGIGPGAAIALATPDGATAGQVAERAQTPADLTAQVSDAVASEDLVVIDAGSVRDWEVPDTEAPPNFHADLVAQLDTQIAAILAGIDQGAAARGGAEPLVLLASLADSGRTPALRLLAIDGEGPGLLATPSTRQVGYVQSTDLLPWILDALDLTLTTPGAESALVGSAPTIASGPENASAGEARLAGLVDAGRHAQAQRPLVAPFYLTLVILNVALFAGVALGLTRVSATRIGAWLVRTLRLDGRTVSLTAARSWVLRALRVVSVALAAIPVSTFLANLVPWWRAGVPGLALFGATAAIVAVVTGLALARPWRHQILTPLGIVAGLTAAVLAIDIATGARLQLSAVMGVPVLVAGRFYGFNNTAFALFTTASILLVVAVTNPLVRVGRRGLAAAIVAGVGVVATVLDGAPGIGADFGGPPAIVPAFALLALMAAGLRITWQRVVGVLGAGLLAVAALAFVDYLRPPASRTHLGRFVATLLDGGAWDVVLRKLEANLRILANNRPLTILAITGVALVVFVLARPVSKAITSPGGGRFAWLSSGAPISRMGDVTPMLRPGLVALAVALGIGFALNDSGIAIPAYGVALAVPLLLAACASWMLTLGAGHSTDAGEPG